MSAHVKNRNPMSSRQHMTLVIVLVATLVVLSGVSSAMLTRQVTSSNNRVQSLSNAVSILCRDAAVRQREPAACGISRESATAPPGTEPATGPDELSCYLGDSGCPAAVEEVAQVSVSSEELVLEAHSRAPVRCLRTFGTAGAPAYVCRTG